MYVQIMTKIQLASTKTDAVAQGTIHVFVFIESFIDRRALEGDREREAENKGHDSMISKIDRYNS